MLYFFSLRAKRGGGAAAAAVLRNSTVFNYFQFVKFR